MNWINFDRLTAHLRAMNPRDFDYRRWSLQYECGCVAVQCGRLAGMFVGRGGGSWLDIEMFLSITPDEAKEMFGIALNSECMLGATPQPYDTRGESGIREALRRLDALALRYERPSAFVPDEQKYLDGLRQLARDVVGVS